MKLTDELFQQLERVERECFGDSWSQSTFLAELNNPLNILCTADHDGYIAGFALGRVAADEGELFQIAVLPEFRRQGAASVLLKQLHREMKSRGAATCFLEVRSRNSGAIALYEGAGYEYAGTRKNYYPDDDARIYSIKF